MAYNSLRELPGFQRHWLFVERYWFAGLNVLALVNTHTAAALQFGYYRNFENRSETVLLYDLGATSVSAALVKFSGLQGNGTAGKGKSARYMCTACLACINLNTHEVACICCLMNGSCKIQYCDMQCCLLILRYCTV